MEAIDDGIKSDSRGFPIAPDWNFVHSCVVTFSLKFSLP